MLDITMLHFPKYISNFLNYIPKYNYCST